MITTLAALGGMVILGVMAMSGFVAEDAPQALVQLRRR